MSLESLEIMGLALYPFPFKRLLTSPRWARVSLCLALLGFFWAFRLSPGGPRRQRPLILKDLLIAPRAESLAFGFFLASFLVTFVDYK